MEKYRERTFTCEGCGESVTKRVRPGTRYCSHECYRNLPKPSRQTGVEGTCLVCGKATYAKASKVRKGAREVLLDRLP